MPRAICWFMSLVILILSWAGGMADLADQPRNRQSYIFDVKHVPLYDCEFAKMVATSFRLFKPTYMVFTFTQCHSGGMLDDLRERFDDTDNVALFSACRYDEEAVILNPKDIPELTYTTGYFDWLMCRSLASLARGELSSLKEMVRHLLRQWNPQQVGIEQTFQWEFLGMGSQIRLDSDPEGRPIPPGRRFAILFVGQDPLDPDGEWALNELQCIYEVLLNAGFLENNVFVLAGSRAGEIAFSDAPGTRESLRQIFSEVATACQGDAGFFFWSTGHGAESPVVRH